MPTKACSGSSRSSAPTGSSRTAYTRRRRPTSWLPRRAAQVSRPTSSSRSTASRPRWSPEPLAEGEGVGLGAGLEERDLQRPVADPVVLAHELVHAALAQHAVAVLVHVHAV